MKNLMDFTHINATTIDEAVSDLRQHEGKACLMSGGTDLLGTMRFEILRDYPEYVINLKTIPGLDYIKEEGNTLKIGALTRLNDIADDDVILNKYPALAEAAHKAASPVVRDMGTIAGNICQINRCWYLRAEDNQFDCLRKGGGLCYAMVGENRYHSIFGATRVVTSPCSTECPASVDIPSYFARIREGDLAGAAEILLDANPLPAITGRVCPHFCEQACNRNEMDQPVSVRSIERYMGDYILENAAQFIGAPKSNSGKKVAIVGAGPAGLAAAYYLRRAGHEVTVYDKMEEAGGMLTYAIPPYRLPKEIVRKQAKALADAGVEYKLGVNIGEDVNLKDLQDGYDSIFLDCGTWSQGRLNIKGEEKLSSGLEFLKNVNQGLRKVPEKVLVIGGGNVAVDVASVALRLGAKEVTVSCLECREEMPAFDAEIEAAVAEGVRLMPSWGPRAILESGGKVTGMELMQCTSVFDENGSFAPKYDTCTTQTIEADEVILAIGQRADIAFLESAPSIKTERGLIAVDADTQATSVDGVFAGGDVTSGPASVSASIAAGRKAAASIDAFLGGKGISTLQKDGGDAPLPFNDSSLEDSTRVTIPELPVAERVKSIEVEDIGNLPVEEIKTEANRCLNCGCVAVNPSDLAPALVALNARVVTSKRTIDIDDFWATNKGLSPTVLDSDEIVTEIQIPEASAGTKSAFMKFALRTSIDFPIVNCAAAIESEKGVVKSARICLNAVYGKPYRAIKAEEAMKGKAIDEANAEAAGAAVVADAVVLPYNKYKVSVAQSLVKKSILSCK